MRTGLAAFTAFFLAACQQGETPDAIFFGGTVYTGVDGAATVEAVSVKGGRILAVGDSGALLKTAKRATELHDLEGAFLYPGFTDAHMHLLGVGEREMTLNLDQAASIAELVSVVGAAAAAAPEGQVLVGRGWIETHWPEARFPTRQDIDGVTGARPVILGRADGHALLANTAALEVAGLMDANPVQPQGGRIEVDAAGLPTGLLIDNAMSLLAALETERTPEQIGHAYELGAKHYAELGWTGGHNMSAVAAHVPRMHTLSDAGRLPLRVYNAVDGAGMTEFAEDLFGRTDSGLVITRGIKLYMDGALGSRGALLEAPYADRPDLSGLQLSKEDETLALMKKAYEGGVQISFHAIGDRGNDLVLNWMEQTFASVDEAERGRRDPRWRIEHAQILSPSGIPRFVKLGVIPSMQPSHAIGDLYFAPARLGDARLDGAYAWRALIDAGAIIPGGSDAPVEKGDPRIEFYAAVARKDMKGASGAGWRPDQRVTREEALKMFTLWPAYASFREKDLGTIEPGKLADFTGFTGDIMTIPESEILAVDPSITVVGGAVTYRRDDQDAAPRTAGPGLDPWRQQALDDVRILSADDMEGRGVGTPGGERARAYIVDRLEALGVEALPSGRLKAWEVTARDQHYSGVNVLGVIPGTRAADRYFVLTAHYDHEGIVDGQIYNGADDNASGVATMLAIAADLKRQAPEHSVLFVALDGEEHGLLGARQFVEAPPVLLTSISLNLNFDMTARTGDGHLWVTGTYQHPVFRPILETIPADGAISFAFGKDTPQDTGANNWVMASDHGVFHRAGVPFLYLGVDYHPDYHKPTDDFERITPASFLSATALSLEAFRALDRSLDQ